jgi:hypothetical protein
MTVRTLVLTACIAALTAGSALAQQPESTPRQAPRAVTPAPTQAVAPVVAVRPVRREGQPINIKVEFTLTDQRTGGPAVKRTVSVVVADGKTGQIRSQSDVIGVPTGVPLNIDTAPELLADGKIRLAFTLQYDWPAPLDQTNRDQPPPRGTVIKTAMHDSATLIVESGKPMTAAQSADPIGDRQVTVEVKATILR